MMRNFTEKSLIDKQKFIAYLQERGLLPKEKLPENVILLYHASAIHELRKKYSTKKQPFFIGDLDIISPTITQAGKKTSPVAIISRLGIGAPSMALFFEKAIALGGKNFIAVGTAGAISDTCKVEQPVVTPWAFRDEGTSAHYLPLNAASSAGPQTVAASPVLFEQFTQTVAKIKPSQKVTLQSAPAWTTDAFYRETKSERDKAKIKGCSIVDMECSAFYAMAEYYKVQALSLFTVSDVLTGDDWAPQFAHIQPAIQNLLDLTVTHFRGDI